MEPPLDQPNDSDREAAGGRWSRVRAIVEQALDARPESIREFVEARAAGDFDVAEEALSMLAVDADDAIGAGEESAADLGQAESGELRFLSPLADRPDREASTAPPTRIGPWELRRRIGRGGMADVWLAVRSDGTYRRRVAIKKLHPGLVTEEVVARFRREQQILANLSHPGIAKMLEAGTDEDEIPYIVMELVDGQPIDGYANERHLSVRERVQLVVSVADAVMAAHRMHIVHRDIKPSNVLVDLEGRPTLLDFGVAKVLDPEKNAGAVVTRDINSFVTLNYASPEQLLGLPLRPTSDVYSLGALTYELLTGEPPLALAGRSTTDAVAMVQSELPERMARRARSSSSANEVARRRGAVSPERLARELADRDLEAIILAALRKEPARRPPDAGAFRDELQRWVAGEPVLSRRDGWVRGVGRMVARNRVVSLLTVSLLVAMALGLWRTTTEARRAKAANGHMLVQAQLAEERLEDLRESTHVLLNGTVESLAGVPGAHHALDRLLRTGISIAKRNDDPQLQLDLGRALGRKASMEALRVGPGESTSDEMARGITLMRDARDRLGLDAYPDIVHACIDHAQALVVLGRLTDAHEPLDRALEEIERLVPRSASQAADVVAMRARVASARAFAWSCSGEFERVIQCTETALEAIAEARKTLPGLGIVEVDRTHSHARVPAEIARLEFIRSALVAIEATLLARRSDVEPRVKADELASRVADIGHVLFTQHGDNDVVRASAAAIQFEAALRRVATGEIEDARELARRGAESLVDIESDRPLSRDELWSHMAGAVLQAELALAEGDLAAAHARSLDLLTLSTRFETDMRASFQRRISIADLVSLAGQIDQRAGRPIEASAKLTRAFALYDDLCTTSPSHYWTHRGRVVAALWLHRVMETKSGDPTPWLERARALLEIVPGDEVALDRLSPLRDEIFAALANRR